MGALLGLQTHNYEGGLPRGNDVWSKWWSKKWVRVRRKWGLGVWRGFQVEGREKTRSKWNLSNSLDCQITPCGLT